MNGHSLGRIIKSNKEILYFTTAGEKPSLIELQRAVGGYFQTIPVRGDNVYYDVPCVLVVDEEAWISKKPLNMIASELALTAILGDVILIPEQYMCNGCE